MLNNYICALDIGSSKISTAIAQIKKRRIINMFFETIPSRVIKRGVVIDAIEMVNFISTVLKNLKIKSGINIRSVSVNISGQDIVTRHSKNVIPLAERGNKVITPSDIQKVNEQARILASCLDEEIIHQIPLSYTLDTKSNVLNPLGLYSHSLEVDLYLVSARLSTLDSLSRAINQAGYELKYIFFSGLATSKAVLNKELNLGTNILCDIGCDITELLVFKDGLLRDIEILTLGGGDLAVQLSEELKIPLDLAGEVMRSYGIIQDPVQIKDDKEILLKKEDVYKPLKQRLVCEIITAKSRLICQAIKEAVDKKLNCRVINNFIITGRTCQLEGFLEMLESSLGCSVKLGRICHPQLISLVDQDSVLSGQRYLTYITALGIICEILQEEETKTLSGKLPAHNFFLKGINKLREVYQEYF